MKQVSKTGAYLLSGAGALCICLPREDVINLISNEFKLYYFTFTIILILVGFIHYLGIIKIQEYLFLKIFGDPLALLFGSAGISKGKKKMAKFFNFKPLPSVSINKTIDKFPEFDFSDSAEIMKLMKGSAITNSTKYKLRKRIFEFLLIAGFWFLAFVIKIIINPDFVALINVDKPNISAVIYFILGILFITVAMSEYYNLKYLLFEKK